MDKITKKALDKDIAATLENFPELQLISNNDISFLKGIYTVKDNSGIVQGEYEIAIVIPKKYPYEFPKLYELSQKITPRIDDRHIDENGLACVEIDQNIVLKSKKGICIKNFIEQYVHRYFCWQLRYDAGDRDGLEEWAHYDKGTLQFYRENLKLDDMETIIKSLKVLSEKSLPKRNDPCICGSNKKYKACHQNLIEKIIDLGKAKFKKDYNTLLAESICSSNS